MKKRTAVIRTRHMWKWLGFHPGMSKIDYLAKGRPKTWPRDNCPLCSFQNKGCSIPGEPKKDCLLSYNKCADYCLWANADPHSIEGQKARVAAADRIVADCQKWLEEDSFTKLKKAHPLKVKKK